MNPSSPSLSRPPTGVQRDVPLAGRTTLGVGGPAQAFAAVQDVAHLQSLLTWAQKAGLGVWLLGEGSNLVVHDAGVPGLALSLAPQAPDAITVHDEGPEHVTVTVPGGVPWGDAVLALSERGLFGVEALYGIPGTCGAAPVQNIGAYGQDVSQTLEAVTLVEVATGIQTSLSAQECGLGYRTSHLRGPWAGRYIVMSLRLRLSRRRLRPIAYPTLVRLLQTRGLDPHNASPIEVAHAVYAVRAQRGMVWRKGQTGPGTVGSFFTNPVVPEAQARALLQAHPTMPVWPGPSGHKLSAAWLIEAAGLPKGWRCEEAGLRVGTSPLHALALVTLAGASANDVCRAATVIHQRVLGRLGVALAAEAQRVGFDRPQAPFG